MTPDLGDLYQDLSEAAKKKYALLQTPEFVEEFMYGHVRKTPLVQRWEGETMIVDITRKVPQGDRFYDWYRR